MQGVDSINIDWQAASTAAVKPIQPPRLVREFLARHDRQDVRLYFV